MKYRIHRVVSRVFGASASLTSRDFWSLRWTQIHFGQLLVVDPWLGPAKKTPQLDAWLSNLSLNLGKITMELKESQKLCRVLGKLIPSRLWLKRFPKVSSSSLLGNCTPSRLWLYQKPKVMLRRLSGNFMFCKPWLNSCPKAKVSWWVCSNLRDLGWNSGRD